MQILLNLVFFVVGVYAVVHLALILRKVILAPPSVFLEETEDD